MRISHSRKGRSIYFKGKCSGFLIKASQEIIKANCERLLERSMCWQVPLPHCAYPKYHQWLCEHGCSIMHHFNILVFFCSPPEHLHPVMCAHCLLPPVPGSVASMDLCRKCQLQFLLCHHVDFQHRAGQQSKANKAVLWVDHWIVCPVKNSEFCRMCLDLCILCSPAQQLPASPCSS